MAVGWEVTEEDHSPSEMIENVKEFPYLGYIIAPSGSVDVDVDRRIMQASKDFGALKRAV